MITRKDMLPIMHVSGALDILDINDEDFLGGHGRETTYVAAMKEAYALGVERAIIECLAAVNGSAFVAEPIRHVARRMGVEL